MKDLIFLSLALMLLSCSMKNEDLVTGKAITTPHAMVVSAHRAASEIGASVLRRGGNAVDAAVATEFALAVCYPEAGNIGGGGFMVIRENDGSSTVIDYREKAPTGAHRDMYVDTAGNVIEGLSTATHLASGVPGTVDGMLTAHTQFGHLPFRDVIQPAIDLARQGFAVTAMQAQDLNSNMDNFNARNKSKTAFVRESPWKEGDILKQEDLANTLIRIRDHGRAGFYSGETAKLIAGEMAEGKGLITLEDLSDYRAIVREPLTGLYRGYKIITVPPPSSGGIILLQLLKMIEPFPLQEWGFSSLKSVHLITEAERRAFADRAEHLGDPDYMEVAPELMLADNYIRLRMSDFDESRASLSTEVFAGMPASVESEETTHYSVIDKDGNAVSATTTLNGTFGNSIVVEGAGFLLNNQMDDFSVKPGFPNMYGLPGGEINAIAPGKRMLSSMTPVIVEKDGKLFLLVGSPGGSTIPTTVFQVITNVIDYRMTIGEAVDTARFHHQWLPDRIVYEMQRFDTTSLSYLKQLGHNMSERSSIGRVSAILIKDDGSRAGGADRRGDNTSCGY